MGMAQTARDSAVRARSASRKLQALPTEERVAMLNRVADALVANEAHILAENAKVGSGVRRPRLLLLVSAVGWRRRQLHCAVAAACCRT